MLRFRNALLIPVMVAACLPLHAAERGRDDPGASRADADSPRPLPAQNAERPWPAIPCEGVYPNHLQGVCTGDDGAIFWSFTDVLVKTDRDGKLITRAAVASHHGDLCYLDGRLYVAVNLGKFNQPAGEADSWVYVYDAESLKELSRHPTPEVVHGAGGIATHDGKFLVVGGLPPGVNMNYVYEYDKSLTFLKRITLPSGYTLMGIQTAAFADGHWWFGCYGKPPVLMKAAPDFTSLGRWEFDASLGIVGRNDGGFLVARGKNEKGKGCTGWLVRAVADEAHGLRIIGATKPPET